MFKEHKPQYSFVWTHTIADVPQSAWDALAMPLKTPFLEWDWLNIALLSTLRCMIAQQFS